jgi:hypothetical protein
MIETKKHKWPRAEVQAMGQERFQGVMTKLRRQAVDARLLLTQDEDSVTLWWQVKS